MPLSAFSYIAKKSGGDLSVFEAMLKLEPGSTSKGEWLFFRVSPESLTGKVRFPTGREGGANSEWIPGGWTGGGVPEAVADLRAAAGDIIDVHAYMKDGEL